MKRLWFFMTIFLLATLISCQSTPYQEAIINKEEDYLTNEIAVKFNPYEAPKRLEMGQQNEHFQLTYACDIEIPVSDCYPVYHDKQKVFADNELLSLMNYFSQDSRLYKEWPYTKEYWHEMIIYGTAMEYPEETIEFFTNQINEAPVEEERIELTISDIPSGQRFFVQTENAYYEYSRFSSIRDGDTFYYQKYKDSTCVPASALFEVERQEWTDSSIEMEEAKIIADKVLADLNITGLSLDIIERACLYDWAKIFSQGWYFVYVTETNNLISHYIPVAKLYRDTPLPSSGAPWDETRVIIYVDEKGVGRFEWNGASIDRDLLVENVLLLPFDELITRIDNQFRYQFSSNDNTSDFLYVKVEKIILGTSRLSIADVRKQGRLVPTWYVYYRIGTKQDEYFEINECTMFNAIDGSYIEPRITNEKILELTSEMK